MSLEGLVTAAGIWRADANLFVRDADNLIVLIGNEEFFSYQNIYSATSEGIQAAAGWTSPDGLMDLAINFTSVDFKNTADSGPFARYKGDRIPNRPYLFANASLRLNWTEVFAELDELSISWHVRFVNEYDLIWESVGLDAFKDSVPAQESHAVGLTYARDLYPYVLNLSAEVQNITDEKLFDFYGVQRPGRAFYVKATLDF